MGDVSPRAYYDRQLRVPGWGQKGQQQLGGSSVLVVGVGGLGCPVLSALARAGVGSLVFCDPDRVEVSNLPRQTLFNVGDVGKLKVQAAAEALTLANPWIKLEPVASKVAAANVRALVEAADLVIDGTDNFATKFLLHDACRSAQKPLVIASLYQWEAQVTAFPFHLDQPGCWRCLYPVAPEDGCVGVCADVGVAGALAGLAGNLQALTACRILLSLGGADHCATWAFDAENWSPRLLKWKPDPQCACQRGGGDWSWLEAQENFAREASWDEVAAVDRRIVVDVREAFEIQPGEWKFFESQGSEVVHYPWSQWAFQQPEWDEKQSYLIVCAKGFRSLAAVETLPVGVRALSLSGGIGALAFPASPHPRSSRSRL